MSGSWKDYLFDSEFSQRDDLETLRKNAELDSDVLGGMQAELHRARARLDRAELVIETLFLTLENQGLLDPDKFKVLLREVDDLDGRVDGKAGVKVSES